jgi:hypothetical protein
VKPDVDRLLEVGAMDLMTRIGPALPSPYEQSSAGALGVLLMAIREEFERGAARRVEENAALYALFERADGVVQDADLAKRLGDARAEEAVALTISALEAENARLRGLLVELHAHLETLDAPEAGALVDAIWSELARSTERRRLAMAVF